MIKSEVKENLTLNISKTKKLLEDGYSMTEIASKLGKPESTIRKWVSTINKSKKETELTK